MFLILKGIFENFVCLVVVQFSMSALTLRLQAFALASSGFASIHHLFPFVNTFFQVFSSFFRFCFFRHLLHLLSVPVRLKTSATQLIPKPSYLQTTAYSFFFVLAAALAAANVSIPHPLPLCQEGFLPLLFFVKR